MHPHLPLHLLPALMAAAEKIGASVEIVGDGTTVAEKVSIAEIIRSHEPEKVEVFCDARERLNEPWRRRNRRMNRKARKSP